MPRTLEDLVRDLIAIEPERSSAIPHNTPATDPIQPWSCTVLRSDSSESKRPKDLPMEIIQELRLPVSLEGIYQQLKQFQADNKHKPFLQVQSGSVLYVESDELQGLVRVYLGSKESLRQREDRAASFIVDEVYEYQQTHGTGSEPQIRLRNRKREDLLSSPDRAQGKSVAPSICFSVFAANAGISSFTIKPEYASKPALFGSKARKKA